MNDETKPSSVEPEPSGHSGIYSGVIARLLAAISAGLGFVAVASCGIPFVPPASTLAIVLGSAGCLAAIAAMVFAFFSQQAWWLLLVIGAVLLAMNGFAVSLGRLGKHLIDYLEGH